jgi:hypothetical protein
MGDSILTMGNLRLTLASIVSRLSSDERGVGVSLDGRFYTDYAQFASDACWRRDSSEVKQVMSKVWAPHFMGDSVLAMGNLRVTLASIVIRLSSRERGVGVSLYGRVYTDYGQFASDACWYPKVHFQSD